MMEIESPIIFNHLPLSKLQIHLTQKTRGSKTMIKAIKKKNNRHSDFSQCPFIYMKNAFYT